jgi:hypothetical protein
MTGDRRLFLQTVGVTLAVLALGVLAQGAAYASSTGVRDEGQLHLVKQSGSVLLEEGPTSGTLPGTVRVRFLYNGGPVVTAQFTIYAPGGSIRAHALGRLNDPNSASPSFAGPLAITGGTGRYAGAQGRGKIYGVLDVASANLILQPVGELRY